MDTDGKIGTMDFTPAASRAALLITDEWSPFFIDSDAFARAERSADAARFAPALENVDVVSLLMSGGNRRGFLGFLLLRARRISLFRGLMDLPILRGVGRFR